MSKFATALAAGTLAATAALSDTVRRDGLDIWYETRGDVRAGTPLLMLHGGLMSAEMTFAELAEALSDHPVIWVEQQLHGHTGDRPAPMSMDSMLKDTLAVLDALEVGKVHVIGFSLGGSLALDMAIHAPDRVASAVILSASADETTDTRREIQVMQENPGTPPTAGALPLLPTQDDFARMTAGYAGSPAGPDAMARAMAAMQAVGTTASGRTEAELAAIEVPVLVVIGDRDFVLPAAAAHVAETVQDGWLAVLPNHTHMQVAQDAAALAPLIRARIGAGPD